ncbi:MAG: membrane protein insertase YidC, partial [Cyanobacteria bacterium J06573_11]
FFPLPAGVLMYMVIANMFQTAQSFILSREPLPENLQKIVDAQAKTAGNSSNGGRKQIAFEPGKRAAKAEVVTKGKNGRPMKSAEPKSSGSKSSSKKKSKKKASK